MQEKCKIIIPEGCFAGNCNSCFFGRKRDMKIDGKILCIGEPGGRNFPYEKDGCRYYISKVIQWIKIIVVVWLMGAGVEVVIGIIRMISR